MLNKGLYSKFRPNPGNRTGRRNRSKKNQNEVWETKSRIFVPKNRIFFCWCLCWNFISSFFFGGLVSKLPPFSRIPKNTISFKFRKQPKWKIFLFDWTKGFETWSWINLLEFFFRHLIFLAGIFFSIFSSLNNFDAAAKTISNFYIKVFLQRDEKYWFLIKMQLYGSLGPSGRALDCKYEGPGFISPISHNSSTLIQKNGANLRQINQGHVLISSP